MIIASTVGATLLCLGVLLVDLHPGLSIAASASTVALASLLIAVKVRSYRGMERVIEAHEVEARRHREYVDAVANDLQRDGIDLVSIDYSADIINTAYGAVLLDTDGNPYTPDDDIDDD